MMERVEGIVRASQSGASSGREEDASRGREWCSLTTLDTV